jgi:hypothetical protein
MFLEKNPKTRPIYQKLLALEDRALGPAFPTLKRISQTSIDFCGPAVLTAYYSFLGVKTSQRRIVKSLRVQNKIKEYGLSIKDLAKASKIVGKGEFTFWRKEYSKVSDLDTIVNKYKWPVGVEWWGVFYEHADEDSGHYGIITRVDKKAGNLRLADSFWEFAGVDRKFKIKDFVKRWWDENEIKGRVYKDHRMMFIITPKRTSWPRKLGMKRV